MLPHLGGRVLELLLGAWVAGTRVTHLVYKLHRYLLLGRWVGAVQQTDVGAEGQPKSLVPYDALHEVQSHDAVLEARNKQLIAEEGAVEVLAVRHLGLNERVRNLHRPGFKFEL